MAKHPTGIPLHFNTNETWRFIRRLPTPPPFLLNLWVICRHLWDVSIVERHCTTWEERRNVLGGFLQPLKVKKEGNKAIRCLAGDCEWDKDGGRPKDNKK